MTRAEKSGARPLSLQGRVGVIGDVHAEDRALEAVLTFLADSGPLDTLLCTGDIVDGEGSAERCCHLLAEAGALTIRGNHDRWYFDDTSVRSMLGHQNESLSLSARTFLRGLPPMRTFDTPLGSLLLCHGVDADDMSGIYPGGDDGLVERVLESYGLPGSYRLMLSGHTHRRMLRPLFDGALTLLNAGTLQWESSPCFSTIDFDSGEVQYYNLAPFTLDITRAETFSLPRAVATELQINHA